MIPELKVASWNEKYAIKLALCILFCVPNLVSVKSVGKLLQFMGIVVLLPFAFMIIVASKHMDISRLPETRPDMYTMSNFRTLLTVLFWNFNGYDCISTCAGEIRNPSKTLFVGLFTAMLIIVSSTAFPLIAAVCWDGNSDGSWRDWKDGSLSSSAESIGGHYLGLSMVIAALVGNCGLFIAELLEDSYQLYGMAQVNLAPSFFGQIHSRFGTPVNAILFLTSIICILISLEFTTILCIDNFFSCSSLILEMCASIRLRQTAPEMHRPYRIPVSTFGLVLLLSPMFLLGTLVLLNELTKSWTHFILNIFGLLLGVVMWRIHVDRTTTSHNGMSSGYQTPRLTSLNGSLRKQLGGYTAIPSDDYSRDARSMSDLNLRS